MSTQLLLLYTWVLRGFAYEYAVVAAIHMGFKRLCVFVLLYTWVLRDVAYEYSIFVAMHMGFKRFC